VYLNSLKDFEIYIENYADLFKKYRIELITSNEQFPCYFPKRT